MQPTYTYSAKIQKIEDSFVTALIDLGFEQEVEKTLRLNGISVGSSEKSKAFLERFVGREVIIKTIKNELGYSIEVFVDGFNLADQMLLLRLAQLFVC